MTFRTLLVATLLVLAGGLIPSAALASDLRVANGRVQMPLSDEAPSAYFVIQSRSEETRTIIGASSPRCESIAIRRTAIVDGRWGSESMPEGMSIPPRASVAFAPRGLFLRLMSADALTEGESIPIVLEFADGEELAFDAVAKAN